MPIKQGNKLVELREEVVKGLERAYQLGLRSAPDFTSFVNNLLLDVIRREEFLAKYKPFSHLNYAGSHAGSLFIRDTQRNVIAEIIFKDQLLYCNSPDSSSDCEHTRFATSLIDGKRGCPASRNKVARIDIPSIMPFIIDSYCSSLVV